MRFAFRPFDLHLKHTWTAARLSRSPVVVGAGIRAAASDQRVFDTLVELGLGDGRIDRRLASGLLRGLLRRTDVDQRTMMESP